MGCCKSREQSPVRETAANANSKAPAKGWSSVVHLVQSGRFREAAQPAAKHAPNEEEDAPVLTIATQLESLVEAKWFPQGWPEIRERILGSLSVVDDTLLHTLERPGPWVWTKAAEHYSLSVVHLGSSEDVVGDELSLLNALQDVLQRETPATAPAAAPAAAAAAAAAAAEEAASMAAYLGSTYDPEKHRVHVVVGGMAEPRCMQSLALLSTAFAIHAHPVAPDESRAGVPVDLLEPVNQAQPHPHPQPEPEPEPHSSGAALTIVHFNDCYHIRNAVPFMSFIEEVRSRDPLILFSGDAFSPSQLSTVTRGSHMVPVLNSIGLNCSIPGNHDLDFGVNNAELLFERTTCPWVLSNLTHADGRQLAGTIPHKVIRWNGVCVGVIGLAEEDWLDTLPTIKKEEVRYIEFVEAGRRLARMLRTEHAVDLVVALTHSRLPNDEALLNSVGDIDLVLGGHDHVCALRQGRPGHGLLVKSGTDFRNASVIEIWLGQQEQQPLPPRELPQEQPDKRFACPRFIANVQCVTIDDGSRYFAHAGMKKLVDALASDVEAAMSRTVGRVEVELDARFELVRTREAAVGNMVADIIRSSYGADIAMVPGGSIRSDVVYPPGSVTFSDILALFPFEDPVMVGCYRGQHIIEALENSVSHLPKLEGRFCQLSGIEYVYDSSQPPGSRYVRATLTASGEPLRPDAVYTVAARQFVMEGGDGFASLLHPERVVVDEEGGLHVAQCVANFFQQLRVVNRLRVLSGEKEITVFPEVSGRIKDAAVEHL